MNNSFSFVYFGGDPIGAPILESLLFEDIKPALVVCSPDQKIGRKRILTPPPVKVVAQMHGIPVFQPDGCRDMNTLAPLLSVSANLYVVVAYNQILPDWLIHGPSHGAVNVHPSMLPKYRGANPIRSAILKNDRHTGVSIMVLDKEMDHGQILAQQEIEITESEWPLKASELEQRLATLGASLLIKTLSQYIEGRIIPKEQEHMSATYTTKTKSEDGEIKLTDDPYQNYLKYCAYDGWPGIHFHTERNGKRVRVKITDASFVDGTFVINKVIPEGKNEISYQDFIK